MVCAPEAICASLHGSPMQVFTNQRLSGVECLSKIAETFLFPPTIPRLLFGLDVLPPLIYARKASARHRSMVPSYYPYYLVLATEAR